MEFGINKKNTNRKSNEMQNTKKYILLAIAIFYLHEFDLFFLLTPHLHYCHHCPHPYIAVDNSYAALLF